MAAACGAPAVGARVLVAPDDSVATVRYVGVVAGTEGEWVGVEYDCAGRGKHDGVHGGVRYFQCAAAGGPQAASFVRPHKLRAGVTLLQALTAKYEQARAPPAPRAHSGADAA
jgi:dynactin complex subunit